MIDWGCDSIEGLLARTCWQPAVPVRQKYVSVHNNCTCTVCVPLLSHVSPLVSTLMSSVARPNMYCRESFKQNCIAAPSLRPASLLPSCASYREASCPCPHSHVASTTEYVTHSPLSLHRRAGEGKGQGDMYGMNTASQATAAASTAEHTGISSHGKPSLAARPSNIVVHPPQHIRRSRVSWYRLSACCSFIKRCASLAVLQRAVLSCMILAPPPSSCPLGHTCCRK